MQEISFSVESSKGISIVRVEGRIDSITHDGLMDAIIALLKEGNSKIVVELSRIEYISSAGWSVFIANLREAQRQNGNILLCGMNRAVKDVFELLELNEVMKSFEKYQDAVKTFEVH